jgi:hypothetical protein
MKSICLFLLFSSYLLLGAVAVKSPKTLTSGHVVDSSFLENGKLSHLLQISGGNDSGSVSIGKFISNLIEKIKNLLGFVDSGGGKGKKQRYGNAKQTVNHLEQALKPGDANYRIQKVFVSYVAIFAYVPSRIQPIYHRN